jgi:hypothetical protein
MPKMRKKDLKRLAEEFERDMQRKEQRRSEKRKGNKVTIRILSDLTVCDMEKAIFHNTGAAFGKLAVVAKQYDSTGLHVLVQYSGGGATPATWVGQRQWIPLALLTST